MADFIKVAFANIYAFLNSFYKKKLIVLLLASILISYGYYLFKPNIYFLIAALIICIFYAYFYFKDLLLITMFSFFFPVFLIEYKVFDTSIALRVYDIFLVSLIIIFIFNLILKKVKFKFINKQAFFIITSFFIFILLNIFLRIRVSDYKPFLVNLYNYLMWVKYFIFFILFMLQNFEEGDFKDLKNSLFFVVLLVLLIGGASRYFPSIINFLKMGEIIKYGLITSTFQNLNLYGIILAFLSCILFFQNLSFINLFLYSFLFVMNLWHTTSTQGILSFYFGVMITGFFRKKIVFIALIIIFTFIFAFNYRYPLKEFNFIADFFEKKIALLQTGIPESQPSEQESIQNPDQGEIQQQKPIKPGEIPGSQATRFELNKIAFLLFLKNPLVGYGYNSFSFISKSNKLYPHNWYLTMLVEGGVVQLILFFALIFQIYKLLKLKKNLKCKSINFIAGYKLSLFILLLSLLTGEYFYAQGFSSVFWVFTGIALKLNEVKLISY